MKMNTNSLSLLDSFWCFKLMNLSLASTDMVPWHLSQGGGMDLGLSSYFPEIGIPPVIIHLNRWDFP